MAIVQNEQVAADTQNSRVGKNATCCLEEHDVESGVISKTSMMFIDEGIRKRCLVESNCGHSFRSSCCSLGCSSRIPRYLQHISTDVDERHLQCTYKVATPQNVPGRPLNQRLSGTMHSDNTYSPAWLHLKCKFPQFNSFYVPVAANNVLCLSLQKHKKSDMLHLTQHPIFLDIIFHH
jgi:hypothetical protein